MSDASWYHEDGWYALNDEKRMQPPVTRFIGVRRDGDVTVYGEYLPDITESPSEAS